MQLGGGQGVAVEATNILKTSGFGTNVATGISASLGAVKLLATSFVVWNISEIGARKLLFTGISMMCLGYVLLTIGFGYVECTESGTSLWYCSSGDISVQGYWDYVILV